MLQRLTQTERLDPADLRRRQFQQLGLLVAHAARTVPYYRDRLPEPPLTEAAWSRLPVLTRRDVQEAGAALHATEVPPGHGTIARAATSGSTGTPVTV